MTQTPTRAKPRGRRQAQIGMHQKKPTPTRPILDGSGMRNAHVPPAAKKMRKAEVDVDV